MAKITLPTITNGQDLSNINNNFALIASALNNNVFYRLNIVGEPDTLMQDMDFNGYSAINVKDLTINGVSAAGILAAASTAVTSATNSAAVATNAAATATAAANTATSIVAGALQKTNNLSDVASAAIALSNLGGLASTTAATTYAPITGSTVYATITNLALKAPIASPSFTGTVGAAAITATGLITPNPAVGIKGTTAAGNVLAGSVGEYVEHQGVTQNVVSGTALSVDTLALTPGDWDVETQFTVVPVGSTITLIVGGNSLTAGTRGLAKTETVMSLSLTGSQVFVTPTYRVNISASTSVFPTVLINWTGGSSVGVTSISRARRVI